MRPILILFLHLSIGLTTGLERLGFPKQLTYSSDQLRTPRWKEGFYDDRSPAL